MNSFGQILAEKLEERATQEYAKWSLRQVSPGRWSVLSPEGEAHNTGFPSEADAAAFIKAQIRAALGIAGGQASTDKEAYS